MQESPLKPLLDEIFDDLPSQMQIAARWLVNHPLEVALLSMREQARMADVPPATMSRIAKRLGFEGFDSLKDVHAQVVRGRPAPFQNKAQKLMSRHAGERDKSLVAEMMSACEQHLHDMSSPAFLATLEKAADVLAKAERVFCLGLRSCFSVTFLYHYIRSLVGTDSILLDGPGGAGLDSLRTITAKDALLVASVNPYVKQTIDAALVSAEKGAKVVAITDSSLSPLARITDTAIIVSTETPSFFPFITPALAAAECLATLVAVRRGEPALAALSESEQLLRAFGAYVADPVSRPQNPSKRTSKKRPN